MNLPSPLFASSTKRLRRFLGLGASRRVRGECGIPIAQSKHPEGQVCSGNGDGLGSLSSDSALGVCDCGFRRCVVFGGWPMCRIPAAQSWHEGGHVGIDIFCRLSISEKLSWFNLRLATRRN